MTFQNKNIEACFHLLQKVLLEAFQTETLFFTPPYSDFKDIDRGIRNIMWPDFLNINENLIPSKDTPERRFFIVRSNLGFYNIIIYLNLEKSPDFFSIGPFRSEEISLDFFTRLIKDLELSPTILSSLQNYYDVLPYVSLSSISSVTKEILSLFLPEFKEISAIYIEFEGEVNNLHVNTQMVHDFSVEYAETYQEKLFLFLEALKKGNASLSHDLLNDFVRNSRILASQNVMECKRNLAMLNGYCHVALLGTNIHPSHILKLFNSLRAKIELLNNRDSIVNMSNDICHKYCLLVKNYAFPEYSKTIRAVINYINLHLDEELTLALLAEKFKKNATSLSSSFSKEVGMNVTNYIHQTRINEAIRYFNTTKMSISEVALAVGFQDFAYFSRLFHKQVGCSPREYCRSIK